LKPILRGEAGCGAISSLTASITWPLRKQKVILDVDLAELYGLPVKRLNEQVKRNRE
jgi:hypothetical protein